MGVQASPGKKFEGRAAAVSGANSWSTVRLHAAGSHPPAVAQAAEAAEAAEAEAFRGTQKKGRKPTHTRSFSIHAPGAHLRI
jgi:hypothetical protein